MTEDLKTKLLERLNNRVPEIEDNLADELLITATDRIALRVEENEFPEKLGSIAVEVVVAMYRRAKGNSEGVTSETVDTFSIGFINNLLDEYTPEFMRYMKLKANETEETDGVVMFL